MCEDSTKEQIGVEIEKKIRVLLPQLKEVAANYESGIYKRMKVTFGLLLKEIKNMSLISVTAAPFSLTVLLSRYPIYDGFLIISFAIFLFNVLILNIGVWYINSELLKSIRSQQLESITMNVLMLGIDDINLIKSDHYDTVFKFFESEGRMNKKIKLEFHELISKIDNIRFFGIALLCSAIFFLICSVVLPLFV